ncbi:hypothetical protein C463_12877 [Halorubrum californiense DSM 19288]|uniref:DUF309 domain-containing protein n=1 Tax=Halorubrum californiense DSM 19288 TaxID=1227465 RepID=M0E1A8_9EURY|nr:MULTISPECIES: hypothetical protein [Halorubrum]ELZ41575.1 hypothetical protein C463_12877 [Halorubrum californiense DSM 19288]TKX69797.1 hypothetical protein EXE40_10400 [Halorubrum sp. GN11GM_10-3_MGM]
MSDRDTESRGGRDSESRSDRDDAARTDRVVAGAALFNEGHHLAARSVWEAALATSSDTGDEDAERLFRGLAAVATATHRAADGDPDGAAERAADAVAALASVSDSRGVGLGPVREWAERLAAAPKKAAAATAPRIRIDDATPAFDDLSLAAAGVAAPALARAGEPGDPDALATAAEFAREERGTGRTEFAELLFAYLRTPDARPQVAARLGDHVDREARKRRDVDGLF